MKSVKLNLVKSSSKKLKEKEMKIISGGYKCGCGCASSGGSDNTNSSAQINIHYLEWSIVYVIYLISLIIK